MLRLHRTDGCFRALGRLSTWARGGGTPRRNGNSWHRPARYADRASHPEPLLARPPSRPRLPTVLALALGLASARAEGAPLELGPDAPAPWVEAASLAGFVPGPCAPERACAQLSSAQLTLRWADGQVEPLALAGRDPETTLAIAASRLALGPPASPAPVRAAAPSQQPPARAAPAPRPAPPTPQPAEPAQDIDPPDPPTEAGPPPSAVVVAAPPLAPRPPPSPLRVEPPRLQPRAWGALGLGMGDTVLLRAEAGGAFGAGWWGLAGQLDAAVTTELGLGLRRRRGPWAARLGIWGGAELRPQDCMMCSVDRTVQSDGTVIEQRTGIFVGPEHAPGWGPAARATLGVQRQLRGPVALSAQLAAAASVRGVWPEARVALFWARD